MEHHIPQKCRPSGGSRIYNVQPIPYNKRKMGKSAFVALTHCRADARVRPCRKGFVRKPAVSSHHTGKREGSPLFDLYTAAVCMTLLFLLITIADISQNRLVTRRAKMQCAVTCLTIALAVAGEWVGVALGGAPAPWIGPHRWAKLLEFCFAPAIGVAAANAYGQVKKPGAGIILVLAHGLFQCIAMRYGWVFRIDGQNLYHREALYPVYALMFILSTAYGFFCIIRGGKQYQMGGIDSVLGLTLLMLTVGIAILFVFPHVRIAYLCIAVANILLYIRYYKTMLQVDAVTRLLNRRCYDVAVSDMEARAVVLFFDIDKFKQVNDNYGHSTGDLCLQNVARALRAAYGRHGRCYRTGGDEFCVILRADCGEVEALNESFRAEIREMQAQDSRMPGVSLGYAYYDAASGRARDVIEEADAMLYRNKAARP